MKLIPQGVTTALSRSALEAAKNEPKALFAFGVAGMACSTVLACRATLRVSDVLEETRRNVDIAESITDAKYAEAGASRGKDLTIIYTQAGVKLVTLYGPSVLLGLASIYCLTRSHGILVQRNLALTAAYAALDEAYTHYRERVVEKYGPDEDLRLRFDSEVVEVEGPRGGIVRELHVSPGADNGFSRYFDQYSRQWQGNSDSNLIFLKCEQRYWRDRLQTRGHVILNDVYESLGLDATTAGALVGWVKDPTLPDIDFGIFDDEENLRSFLNGREAAILLDFNPHGVVYDLIDARKELERT